MFWYWISAILFLIGSEANLWSRIAGKLGGRDLSRETDWYNSTRTPPPGFEHYVKYALKNQCAQGPYKNIEKDLAPFRDPLFPEKRTITKELVQEAKDYALGTVDVVLFRVENGKASVFWEDLEYPSWATDFGGIFMDRLVEMAPHLPNMELLMNFHDFPKVLLGDEHTKDVNARFEACTGASQQFRSFRHLHHTHGGHQLNYSSKLLPIFSQTKVEGCHMDIQYPTLYNWNGLLSMEDRQKLLPWKERKETLIFRGATTGGHYSSNPGGDYRTSDYEQLHRFRLVEQFRGEPDMDFQFTNYVQCHNLCAELESKYGSKAAWLTQEQLLGHYKYLMAVEGNSFLSRWPKYLTSGALSFRAGLFREWFDEWMRPFDGESGHYIPVNFDYSNLASQLHWAQGHDSTAQKIAAAAEEFARKRVRNEDLVCYLWRLLLEYSALLER